MRYASRAIPHYRRTLHELGIDTGTATPELIPLTHKESLRASPDDFVGTTAKPWIRVTTTGTSGNPAVVHFSSREWRTIGALSAYSMLAQGILRPDDLVQICITPRAVLPNHAVMSAAAAAGAVVQVVGMAHPHHTLELLSARHRIPGKRDQVSVLTGNPSYVGLLVEYGLAAGWRPEQFAVKRMLLGGELMTDGFVRRLQQLFGPVHIRQSYALTELVPLNGRICRQGHVHFEPTAGLVEVVDPDTGEPAAPGQVGTIVGTPFRPYRDTTTLIRFDTGDAVRALPTELTCELPHLPGVGQLLGKLSSAVRHDDGWTFAREIAEAVEAVEAVPLPGRHCFAAVQGGVAVELVVRPSSNAAAARRAIGDQLEDRAVPVRSITIVEDPAMLSKQNRLRCDTDEGGLLRRQQAFRTTGRG